MLNVEDFDRELEAVLGDVFNGLWPEPETYVPKAKVKKTYRFLTPDEIVEAQNEWDDSEHWKKGKFGPKAVDTFALAYWDNNNLKYVPWTEEEHAGFIALWKNAHKAKSFFMFGYFKDLMGLTHEEMYAFKCKKMLEEVNGKSGLDLWVEHFPDFYQKYTGGLMSNEAAVEAISIRMWESCYGIAHEGRVHKTLKARYDRSEKYLYKEAPNSMEGKNVDGLIVDRNSGDIVEYVSIKAGGALSINFLTGYHPKHKKATIYVGFANRADQYLTVIKSSEIEKAISEGRYEKK